MHIYTQFKKGSHRTTTTSTIQAPSTTNNDNVYLYRGKNTIIEQASGLNYEFLKIDCLNIKGCVVEMVVKVKSRWCAKMRL